MPHRKDLFFNRLLHSHKVVLRNNKCLRNTHDIVTLCIKTPLLSFLSHLLEVSRYRTSLYALRRAFQNGNRIQDTLFFEQIFLGKERKNWPAYDTCPWKTRSLLISSLVRQIAATALKRKCVLAQLWQFKSIKCAQKKKRKGGSRNRIVMTQMEATYSKC